jgi:hypothetical protein
MYVSFRQGQSDVVRTGSPLLDVMRSGGPGLGDHVWIGETAIAVVDSIAKYRSSTAKSKVCWASVSPSDTLAGR